MERGFVQFLVWDQWFVSFLVILGFAMGFAMGPLLGNERLLNSFLDLLELLNMSHDRDYLAGMWLS